MIRILIFLWVIGSGSELLAQSVNVLLTPTSDVRDQTVRLGDIADVSMSDRSAVPKGVLQIDLIRIPDGESAAIIRKSMIDVRLQLYGLRSDHFRIRGPEQIIAVLRAPKVSRTQTPVTLVSQTSPAPAEEKVAQGLSDEAVETAILDALTRRFVLHPEDISAELLKPFVTERMQALVPQDVRIEVLTPTSFPYGRAGMMIRLWKGRSLVSSALASVRIQRRRSFLVARRYIPATAPITRDLVQMETGLVDREYDEISVADIQGLKTRRAIRAGEPLSFRDVAGSAHQRAETVVRARDSVRVIGFRNGLRFVIPAAQALQSGRVGEVIRVRNLQSNRVISAKVTGPGEVEVPL